MRTDKEIVERLKEIESNDEYGFERNYLLEYLSFSHAKPFLKEGVTEEEWDNVRPKSDEDSLVNRIEEHLEVAWFMANNRRTLQCKKSLSLLRALTWMKRDGLFPILLSEEKFRYHGKPQFAILSNSFLEITSWRDLDNGEWVGDTLLMNSETAIKAWFDEFQILPFQV